MKLTTERLKKLIREEFQRLNESIQGMTQDKIKFEIETRGKGLANVKIYKNKFSNSPTHYYIIAEKDMQEVASGLKTMPLKDAFSVGKGPLAGLTPRDASGQSIE